MIVEKVGNHTIKRYSSVDDMPIDIFMSFMLYLIVDSGIGSDVDAINEHDRNIIQFAKKEDYKKIIQEVVNRNECLNQIISKSSPEFMAYAVTVKSIDGIEIFDHSDEGCKLIVKRLIEFKATKGFLGGAVEFLRKKLEGEIDYYFPENSDKSNEVTVSSKRKKRLLSTLDELINEKSNQEEIQDIDDFIFSMIRPKNYSGETGFIKRYKKSYEDMSFILSQHTSINPKKMTTLEYFNSWEIVKKQMKPKPNK